MRARCSVYKVMEETLSTEKILAQVRGVFCLRATFPSRVSHLIADCDIHCNLLPYSTIHPLFHTDLAFMMQGHRQARDLLYLN